MIKQKKTNQPNIKLPSNQKFGYFFSAIFLILGLYLLYSKFNLISYIFFVLSVIFIIVAYIKPILLFPLNKLWMQLGFFLGKIISPIILGFIFFGLFTPYSIVMKIFRRDELNLKKFHNKSYWVSRLNKSNQTNFKRQF